MSGWRSQEGRGNTGRYSRGGDDSYSSMASPGTYSAPTGSVGSSVDERRFMDTDASNAQAVAPAANVASSGRESIHRIVGLSVGLASVSAEHILSHPCIVLRRQCQVHTFSDYYHTTPFTLFGTIFNLQRNQSASTLWKGLGSTLMVKGLGVATETAICETTPFPREITRHTPFKKVMQHILMKSLSFLVVTPFYAASLVETVQSETASERPGVFDSLREGLARLVTLTQPQTTRRLPVWKLFAPMLLYGVLHYVIKSLAQYTVILSVRSEILEGKQEQPVKGRLNGSEKSVERSLYETHYPELVATFTGNLLADTMLFPLETMLHRLCLQGTRTIIDNTDSGLDVIPIQTRYEGLVDSLRVIINEEGFAGLYKGFGALILQYALHAAILKLTRLMFQLLIDHSSAPTNVPQRLQLVEEDLLPSTSRRSSARQRKSTFPR